MTEEYIRVGMAIQRVQSRYGYEDDITVANSGRMMFDLLAALIIKKREGTA